MTLTLTRFRVGVFVFTEERMSAIEVKKESKRKYKRSIEVKLMQDSKDICISEHVTDKESGTEWEDFVFIGPAFLGEVIDALRNRKTNVKVGNNRVASITWHGETVRISTEKEGSYYYKDFTVWAKTGELIPILEKFHQDWLNRDHQLDLFE